MSASSTFTIGLSHTGDTDASYRLQRRPGEIQHVHLIQDESELSVQADLFSVLHGTYTPGGDAASLVVIDFRFTGSDSRRKRFREATIDVQFALENEKSGSRLDPEVVRIAPNGMFKMDPSVQQTSTKLSTNATVSGGGGPMTFGIAGGWEKTKSMDEESWAAMSGRPRIEGRIDGSYNAAMWKLRENSQQKHGIPSILRVAILLVPRSPAKFRAFVRIDTAVDLLSSAQQRLKNFLGGVVVDPVYFDDEGKRKPLGPKPANVDVNNLSACDLGKLSYDGLDGPSPPIGITGPVDLPSPRPNVPTRPALAPSSSPSLLPPPSSPTLTSAILPVSRAPAPPLPSPTPPPVVLPANPLPANPPPAPVPPNESPELVTVIQRLQLLEKRNRYLEESLLFQEKRNLFLEERVLLLEKDRLGLREIMKD